MIKKLFVGIIVIALISALVYVFTGNKKAYIPYTSQQNLNAPIELPADGVISIEEANNINKPQVILFYVDWCGYCRNFMPKFGEFAKQYSDRYSFAVINADLPENRELVEKFHIIGFPSLFIVDNEINHNFSMHAAASADENIMREELDAYLAVKDKIKNK